MRFALCTWVFCMALVVLLAGCADETPPELHFEADGFDFARLEHESPLSREDLQKLAPANIAEYSQEQVDQIYARLSAGPIPDGLFDGALFFPRGADRSRLAEIVDSGGIGGRLKGRVADIGGAKVEFLGKQIWKGKAFYRADRLLRNRIEDLLVLKAVVRGLEDDQLEANRSPDGDHYLLFPAKLYCGHSLLDGRRESIVIDYAHSDKLPGYIETLDHLVGGEGLRIRDEVRMVRPGFYLGRAYIDRLFALNFTLYNESIAAAQTPTFAAGEPISEDCWLGEQRLTAARD